MTPGAPTFTMKTAVFSDCRQYRYALWREIDQMHATRGILAVIGLNPSTADETLDDPTIRRVKRFAFDWGFGALCMLNLFAFRATDPDQMMIAPDPIGGVRNMENILLGCGTAGMVLCAWGKGGRYMDQDKAVTKMLAEANVSLHCLSVNQNGTPKHPLYVAADVRPIAFKP